MSSPDVKGEPARADRSALVIAQKNELFKEKMNRFYGHFGSTKSTRNVCSHTKTYGQKFSQTVRLIVVLETQVSDQILAAHVPQRIL
jgi:hypothetical protein